MLIYTNSEPDSSGRSRIFAYLECDYCNNPIRRELRHRHKEVDACSPKCLSILKGTRTIHSCAHCQKEFTRSLSKAENSSKHGVLFCSRECKDIGQTYIIPIQPSHYGTATKGYRQIALKHLPIKCNRCGYNDNVAGLVVHHIDHNRDNNSITNLEILCGTCHMIHHNG